MHFLERLQDNNSGLSHIVIGYEKTAPVLACGGHVSNWTMHPKTAGQFVCTQCLKAAEPQTETLYDAIVAAGINTAAHESDLYFPVTAESRAILERFPLQRQNATMFANQVEGGRWYDVPFAYMPFWDRKARP